MLYNPGEIVFEISNHPRVTHSADLKLLARLLPELYSTQSSYILIILEVRIPSVCPIAGQM